MAHTTAAPPPRFRPCLPSDLRPTRTLFWSTWPWRYRWPPSWRPSWDTCVYSGWGALAAGWWSKAGTAATPTSPKRSFERVPHAGWEGTVCGRAQPRWGFLSSSFIIVFEIQSTSCFVYQLCECLWARKVILYVLKSLKQHSFNSSVQHMFHGSAGHISSDQ